MVGDTEDGDRPVDRSRCDGLTATPQHTENSVLHHGAFAVGLMPIQFTLQLHHLYVQGRVTGYHGWFKGVYIVSLQRVNGCVFLRPSRDPEFSYSS